MSPPVCGGSGKGEGRKQHGKGNMGTTSDVLSFSRSPSLLPSGIFGGWGHGSRWWEETERRQGRNRYRVVPAVICFGLRLGNHSFCRIFWYCEVSIHSGPSAMLGRNCEDVISTLRNGSTAVKSAALMKQRGYTNRRRSRHRLTPRTVKFVAFHVLSLEGDEGLSIVEVAEKIQRFGLRDLTTSKTPEASISAALSRDTKLFERTAPSTYCVKTPYRKDPADFEVVFSSAWEK
ncbi:Homeobox-DDT domain protein RLT2 [Hordeum vulgare]|nr:Homeobox-DDT domain protein RLT2 [Hordeum vulgare]